MGFCRWASAACGSARLGDGPRAGSEIEGAGLVSSTARGTSSSLPAIRFSAGRHPTRPEQLANLLGHITGKKIDHMLRQAR